MDNEFANIQLKPILNNNFAKWFQELHYNGKELSDEERKEVIAMIDETIDNYKEGLPLAHQLLDVFKDQHDDFHETYRTVASVMLFVLMTIVDCMVLCKYFILADKEYDRRFMRGKLTVLLNEGFKRLYGFDDKTYKKSEWDKLLPLMRLFPEVINRQYQEMTFLLEKHSKSSSWWKEERNLETHLDAVKLYESRQEEIVESKVVMDSMKLICSLMAVNDYLYNLHTCLYNYLANKYKKGELLITQ